MASRPPLAGPPAYSSAPSLDASSVAEWLLTHGHVCTALELHTELCEGNNGMHNVAALNKTFNDPDRFMALVRSNEAKARESASTAALGSAMGAIQSPFIVDGLHASVASRDQTIALLTFQVRALEEALAKAQRGGDEAGDTPAPRPDAGGSSIAPWYGTDEEGTPITARERATLNALVRRYLLARGYKSTYVALAAEVRDQDLSLDADDASLLSLPGGKRGGGGRLSLLAMHRKRIAPIQALADVEARSDGAISALRTELRVAHEQLDMANGEVEAGKSRIAALEQQIAYMATVRGSGAPAPAPVNGTAAPASAVPAAAPVTATPAAAPRAPPATGGSGNISMSNAPALLRAVGEGLPILSKHIVTKNRSVLIPILAAAIAVDGVADSRRGLFKSLLMLIHRPTHAERQLIKTQVGVLASKLGGSVESEMMTEIMRLAESGRTKERKALAAVLCGALSPFVSDQRVDGLLATLTSLAESPHAVVRVGVVDGLAAVAHTMSDRWKRALASGTIVGTSTSLELQIQRQFGAVEDLMWRALLSNTDDNDTAELALAALNEFQLALPPHMALSGTPAHAKWVADSAAAAAAAPAKGGKGVMVPPLSIPASWSQLPTSVAAAVSAALVPVVTVWAYRLNVLWSRFVPGVLSLLEDTLHRAAPVDGMLTTGTSSSGAAANGTNLPLAGRAAASVRLTEWHQRRATLILGMLRAAATNLRIAAFDEGYSVTMLPAGEGGAPGSPADAPASGSPAPAVAQVPADMIFELFDFATQAAIQSFPPEKPIEQRAGAPPPPATIASQARQAMVLSALVKGTVAVRARRNIPASVELPANIPPYMFKPIRDEQVTLSWPAMRFIVRTLVAGLIRQSACVNRSSAAGRAIVDAYADALGSLCAAFGPSFTAYVVRPMFQRALGMAVELPPKAAAPGAPAAPTTPGAAPAAAPAAGMTATGREPRLLLLAYVLLGVPARATDARTAAGITAAVFAKALATNPAAAATVNYGNAGPKGSDWPFVLPELAWMHRDSLDNPTAWSGRGAAAFPPLEANGIEHGGVWNASALLPVYGSSVMASPELLKASKDLLMETLKHLILLIAGRRHGWEASQHQALLEDCVRRAGGGNSVTGSVGATAAQTHAPTASMGSSAGAPLSPGTTASATVAVSPSNSASPALAFIVADVLPMAAAAKDPAVRAVVAGLYRSIIPLLSAAQLHEHFLPTMKRMSRDGDAKVTSAAVRALADVYSTGACNDDSVRHEVNDEIEHLLKAGPKDVVMEIVRALMRAIPNAAPALRDDFILNKVLELNQRLVDAAEAGATAMREFCRTVGDIEPGDVHSAAAQAARAQRAAAIQGFEVWRGAKADDLEEVAMSLCETFRAFGPCALLPETKGVVRDAASALLDTDLLNPSYRDMMRATLDSFFPVEHPQEFEGVDDPYAAQAEAPHAADAHDAAAAAAASGVTIGSGFSVPVHAAHGHDGHESLMGSLGMGSLATAFKGSRALFTFGMGQDKDKTGAGPARTDSMHGHAPSPSPAPAPFIPRPAPPPAAPEAPTMSLSSFAGPAHAPAPAPPPAPITPLLPGTDLRAGAAGRSAAAAAPVPAPAPAPAPADAPTFNFSSFAAQPAAPAPAPHAATDEAHAAPAPAGAGSRAAGALGMTGIMRSMRAAVGSGAQSGKK